MQTPKLPVIIGLKTRNILGSLEIQQYVLKTENELKIFMTMYMLIDQKVTMTEQNHTKAPNRIEYYISK